MAKPGIAKLFQNGRSQAVRLPREFRFEGDSVRIRRTAEGVLLEPVGTDVVRWFEDLDEYAEMPFFVNGRKQPVAPKRKVF
jgi:antitoxin VapB